MKINIEKYNPDWKKMFEDEKQSLLTILSGQGIKIEHIGSTAVEGLGAKPVIDIMVGLTNFRYTDDLIPKIIGLGYRYIKEYDSIMPYRRFFVKENHGIRTHHIHMVEIGTNFWVRHLKFRDHLRTNKMDREKYYQLKKELSKREWADGNEYAYAKSEFIKKIEGKLDIVNYD